MAESSASGIVDLDLDVLQPTPKTFRFHGQVYRLPAEVPIPTVVRALQLLGSVEDAKDEQIFQLVTEMYELLVAVLRQVPDQTLPDDLQFSQREVLLLLGLLTGQAGQTLPEAVVDTLKAGGATVDAAGNLEELPPTPPKPAPARKRAGSRSGRRLPARSSA